MYIYSYTYIYIQVWFIVFRFFFFNQHSKKHISAYDLVLILYKDIYEYKSASRETQISSTCFRVSDMLNSNMEVNIVSRKYPYRILPEGLSAMSKSEISTHYTKCNKLRRPARKITHATTPTCTITGVLPGCGVNWD